MEATLEKSLPSSNRTLLARLCENTPDFWYSSLDASLGASDLVPLSNSFGQTPVQPPFVS